MGIPVRALSMGYMGNPYNRRIKPGEVFEIRTMKQFSEKWMVKVGGDAESDIEEKKPSDGRIERPLSDGSKAVHEGRAGKSGKAANEGPLQPEDEVKDENTADNKSEDTIENSNNQQQSNVQETTGDEDMI